MTELSPPKSFDPAMLDARSGHIVALGIRYVAHGTDWIEMALDYDRRLTSDPATGILASGPIVSLFDTALGLSTVISAGAVAPATLDLRVDYLRPASPGNTVTVRAECYRTTRRVAFVRGTAHDGDPARPIAQATGTFMLIDAPTQ